MKLHRQPGRSHKMNDAMLILATDMTLLDPSNRVIHVPELMKNWKMGSHRCLQYAFVGWWTQVGCSVSHCRQLHLSLTKNLRQRLPRCSFAREHSFRRRSAMVFPATIISAKPCLRRDRASPWESASFDLGQARRRQCCRRVGRGYGCGKRNTNMYIKCYRYLSYQYSIHTNWGADLREVYGKGS